MHNSKLSPNHLDYPLTQFRLRYARSVDGNGLYNADIVNDNIKSLKSQLKPWKLPCHVEWKSVYNEFNKQQFIKRRLNKTSFIDYSDDRTNVFEPIFTNKVPEFAECIDYIYYNKPIKIISVLKFPYEKHVQYDEIQENFDYQYLDFTGYVDQRHEQFKVFRQRFMESLKYIKQMRARIDDQLLFCGYMRRIINYQISKNEIEDIAKSFILYYCTQESYSKLVQCHDDYLSLQSFWRPLYSSHSQMNHPITGDSSFDIIINNNNDNDDDDDDNDNNDVNFDFDEFDPEFMTKFNAFNYPYMPNRKDPSDHFALCCDCIIR